MVEPLGNRKLEPSGGPNAGHGHPKKNLSSRGGKSRFDCSEKKVKGVIHLPEQAILILQRKKITPNERKGGNRGRKVGFRPEKNKIETPSRRNAGWGKGGRGGGGSAPRLTCEAPAARVSGFRRRCERRGKWVLLFRGRRQARSVNCSLLSSINPPHTRGVVVAWNM